MSVDGGRITGVGEASERFSGRSSATRDLGRVALLPGLINAHTHLELSWLKDRVPPAASFIAWVTQLFAVRGASLERPGDARVREAADAAVLEARESGTIAVGDISNSLASIAAIAAGGLDGLVFHELLGFADETDRRVAETRPSRESVPACSAVRISVAPHAPYSVSRELFQAIRAEVDGSGVPITSVHVGESTEEMEMMRRGTGPWPGLLKLIGAWREGWEAPGVGPVEFLDDLGMLDERTLVVHGVQLDDRALARLVRRGCTLVTCPRSNQWVGVGAPPIGRFYESGVRVAVGTDSLASVADLNVFAELAAMRWLAPSVPAARFLESATRIGAEALGLGHELGTIAVGKRAALIAVDVPARITDVEEYLVSGIEPRQVQWVRIPEEQHEDHEGHEG
ncbi:MAG: amidohydrolase family protein [Acidobacteria bacterium]|nr:amidohydrolase family protein [Acidobacteriota bacterium]